MALLGLATLVVAALILVRLGAGHERLYGRLPRSPSRRWHSGAEHLRRLAGSARGRSALCPALRAADARIRAARARRQREALPGCGAPALLPGDPATRPRPAAAAFAAVLAAVFGPFAVVGSDGLGRACTRRPAIPAAREPRRRSPARGGSARDLRRAGRRWLHRRTLARSRRLAAGRSRTCDDPAAGGRGPGRPLARRPLAGRPGAPRRRIRGDRGGRPGVREVHLHAVLAVAASTRPARAGPVAVAASALLAAAMVLGQLWFFHYRELFSVDDVAWLVVARDVLLVALYGVLLAALRRSTKIPSSSSTVSHSPLASSLANGIAAVDGAERRSR
jgi:hypothetical protein